MRFVRLACLGLPGLFSSIVAIGLCAPAAAQAPAAAATSASDTFQSELERIRRRSNLPALAAGAYCGERLIGLGATGFRRTDRPDEVTVGDRFYIGSIAKSMTATMIGRLVERGLLSWDTQVQQVFPELAPRMAPAVRSITLRQLLSHRSGLMKFTDPAREYRIVPRTDGPPQAQRLAFVQWLLQQGPVSEPGSRLAYSNGGYAVAVTMAERITGQSLETLLDTHVFEPLGLASAGFDHPALHNAEQPWGHEERGGRLAPLPPERKDPWQSNIQRGAGNVHMSIGDLLRYLRVHLQGLRGEASLLRPETFRALHAPESGSNYALGWAIITNSRGERMSMHDGSDDYFLASVLVWPERNFIGAVAQNAGISTDGPSEAIQALVDQCPRQ